MHGLEVMAIFPINNARGDTPLYFPERCVMCAVHNEDRAYTAETPDGSSEREEGIKKTGLAEII